MKLALRQAEIAAARGETPVGAVIVKDGKILSAAHNERETLKDPTAHAEVLAIRRAAEETGDWRLGGAVLYVTLEPCVMCAGAIAEARIATAVFGAWDNGAGAFGGGLFACPEVGHRGGVLQTECSVMLKAFFSNLRKNGCGAISEAKNGS